MHVINYFKYEAKKKQLYNSPICVWVQKTSTCSYTHTHILIFIYMFFTSYFWGIIQWINEIILIDWLINNNNNYWLHLYSAFLCTQSAFNRRGMSSTTTSVQYSPEWCDGSHITPERPPPPPPPPAYWWRGDRVMKPISVWGWLGGHDGQRPVEGIWPGCRGYTPTLFSKDILGFLMTTERQDLSLTSHPI